MLSLLIFQSTLIEKGRKNSHVVSSGGHFQSITFSVQRDSFLN